VFLIVSAVHGKLTRFGQLVRCIGKMVPHSQLDVDPFDD
jgi:hypothetical protein